MNKDLSNRRKTYKKQALTEEHIPTNPLALFKSWYDLAETNDAIEEPNAMTLATIDLNGIPKSRIVLLKQFDVKGFVFYTNYNSEKGKSIRANPNVCLSFFWPVLEQQVIIKGLAQETSSTVSDAYFNKRPLGSRLGAMASNQSDVIKDRSVLDNKLNELEKEYAKVLPSRPDNWGGFLVTPSHFEFWQGRPNRLHDRILYTAENSSWKRERLAP
jgi:pyridoxamine 5'-phosphate oxidase